MTVVVLDTRRGEVIPVRLPLESRDFPSFPTQKTEPTAPSAALRPVLSHLLNPRRIVIWNQPDRKELALRTLVDVAVAVSGIGDPATVLGLVLKREEEGSTFFNEGMGYLHARVSRNRHLLLMIQSCRTPEEALSAVQDRE